MPLHFKPVLPGPNSTKLPMAGTFSDFRTSTMNPVNGWAADDLLPRLTKQIQIEEIRYVEKKLYVGYIFPIKKNEQYSYRPTDNWLPLTGDGIDLKRYIAVLWGKIYTIEWMVRQQGSARLNKSPTTKAHCKCDDLKAKKKANEPVEGTHQERKTWNKRNLDWHHDDLNSCISQASVKENSNISHGLRLMFKKEQKQ